METCDWPVGPYRCDRPAVVRLTGLHSSTACKECVDIVWQMAADPAEYGFALGLVVTMTAVGE